jgi:uncharacterized membrane protein YdjX (TVP38/TMEM64 family)
MNSILKKIALFAVIIAGAVIIIKLTPFGKLLDLENIYAQKDQILASVRANFILSAIIFTASYIIVVALSIPGASILSILGGFLFAPVAGTILINIGATSGAYIIFMAARYFLGGSIQEKYSISLEKFNRELDKNGKNYMLTLRFIPVFPFFLINLLAGFTKISSLTFLWTTAVGIIPGSFVYAYIGYAGSSIDSRGVFRPEILTALILLAVLSLVPVLLQKFKKRGAEAE